MGERGCEAVAELVPRLRGELGLDAALVEVDVVARRATSIERAYREWPG